MYRSGIEKIIIFFILLIAVGAIFSCKNINPSLMFRTPKDYVFNKPDTITVNREYQIAPNDMVTFEIYANDGFKLIDIGSSLGTAGAANGTRTISFIVDQNGDAKLPVLGKTKLSGFTIREAETMLEQKFTQYYNKPFIILRVMNKRVTIFPGSASSARVVVLTNENTTLFEAIALAGGITITGKARQVKLIRGSLKNPKIFLINLNTLEGIKKADLFVQAGDIIYVDQVPNIAQGVLSQFTPYVAILSTFVSLITIYYTVKQLGAVR